MGLSRRAVPVLTALAAGLVAGVAFTALEDRTYRATAVLQAVPAVDPRVLDPGARRLAADVVAATYADLLSAPSFTREVAPLVGVPAEELESRMDARRPTGTALVEVVARGASRSDAEALASGVANAFLSLVRQLERQRTVTATAQLERRAADLTRRVAALRRRGIAEDGERVVALRSERSAVERQLAELAAPTSVSLVGSPSGTSERIRPDLFENLLGGLVLGIVGGLGVALLSTRREERRAVGQREPESVPESESEPVVEREPGPEPGPEQQPEPEPRAEAVEPPPAPPPVSMLTPSEGAVLRGRVPLVARRPTTAVVRFLVSDGGPEWQPLVDVAPGQVGAEWDTTSVPDGQYWLSAVATNGAGLSSATEPLAVRVENGG